MRAEGYGCTLLPSFAPNSLRSKQRQACMKRGVGRYRNNQTMCQIVLASLFQTDKFINLSLLSFISQSNLMHSGLLSCPSSQR